MNVFQFLLGARTGPVVDHLNYFQQAACTDDSYVRSDSFKALRLLVNLYLEYSDLSYITTNLMLYYCLQAVKNVT